MERKISYLKALPALIKLIIEVAPILFKHGKALWDELANKYDKTYLTQLDNEIIKHLEIGDY